MTLIERTLMPITTMPQGPRQDQRAPEHLEPEVGTSGAWVVGEDNHDRHLSITEDGGLGT